MNYLYNCFHLSSVENSAESKIISHAGIGISRVIAQAGTLEHVRVPAGGFDVIKVIYRVEKATGVEQYIVYASRQQPRTLVREDFPDGMVTELVSMRKSVKHPHQ